MSSQVYRFQTVRRVLFPPPKFGTTPQWGGGKEGGRADHPLHMDLTSCSPPNPGKWLLVDQKGCRDHPFLRVITRWVESSEPVRTSSERPICWVCHGSRHDACCSIPRMAFVSTTAPRGAERRPKRQYASVGQAREVNPVAWMATAAGLYLTRLQNRDQLSTHVWRAPLRPCCR